MAKFCCILNKIFQLKLSQAMQFPSGVWVRSMVVCFKLLYEIVKVYLPVEYKNLQREGTCCLYHYLSSQVLQQKDQTGRFSELFS